jgi:hypothetical protein
MLRARSSAGKRERELALRNAGESWPVLNPDVLVDVAATLDVRSLSRFPAVCRGWRDAIADCTNALWAPLLQERFPRAFVALELLPAAALCYKEIYRDQLAAKQLAVHRPSACPTTCSLADFVFTFELFRETPVVDPPAHRQFAVQFYVEEHKQQYLEDHPHLNAHHACIYLSGQYRALSADAKQPYLDRAAVDEARFKRETAQYNIDAAAAWNASPVVTSWTGNLDALPRRDGAECSFRVPIRWDDWHQAWESEDAQVNRMRLHVLVSRVVNGSLRTQSIMTSQRTYDVTDVGMQYMLGQSLRYDHERAFEHDHEDEYDVTADLQLEFHQVEPEPDDEDPVDDGGERPWNFEDITANFQLHFPESHSDPIQREQLLGYLEHGLRWDA